MQHSIVCGVDGSQPSRSAARVAARLARALDLRFVLAHAREDRPTFPYRDRRLGELQRRRAIEDGQRLLEDVAAELSGVVPETRVVLGFPVEALSALCREESAELLIVGSRGRGPLKAAVLGSVSARLASTAECPVLVVPALAAADRFLAREATGGSIVCGVDTRVQVDHDDAVDGLLGARRWHAGSMKESHMSDQTTTQRAVRQQQVGRFSDGIEQRSDTPSKRRVGRFSAGIEQRPQGGVRRGRFSDGNEQLPRTPSRLRRGSFANGYDEVR